MHYTANQMGVFAWISAPTWTSVWIHQSIHCQWTFAISLHISVCTTLLDEGREHYARAQLSRQLPTWLQPTETLLLPWNVGTRSACSWWKHLQLPTMNLSHLKPTSFQRKYQTWPMLRPNCILQRRPGSTNGRSSVWTWHRMHRYFWWKSRTHATKCNNHGSPSGSSSHVRAVHDDDIETTLKSSNTWPTWPRNITF